MAAAKEPVEAFRLRGTRFIIIPLYGDASHKIYDIPVNGTIVIGRNDSPALENQHISRGHVCISVNFDVAGKALLLAHNTGKNTFRIVSFARRKHARVQQAKFCRLYSGDIVEMLYDTQAQYALQVLEVSATGLPLTSSTPVVGSLHDFRTATGNIPVTSSQAAKQALVLGKQRAAEEAQAALESKPLVDAAAAAGTVADTSGAIEAREEAAEASERAGGLAVSGSPTAHQQPTSREMAGVSGAAAGAAAASVCGGATAPLLRRASDTEDGATDGGGVTRADGIGIGDLDFERETEDVCDNAADTGGPREGSAGPGSRASSPYDGATACGPPAGPADSRMASAASEGVSGPGLRASAMRSLAKGTLRNILSFLTLPNLLSCTRVCRRWEDVINTSGVLGHIRLGAACAGVVEPPFRLLMNVASRSRWCLSHLSLARCRWATAGHLALLLGVPFRLRPHAVSVSVADPALSESRYAEIGFAADGPPDRPGLGTPALHALPRAAAPGCRPSPADVGPPAYAGSLSARSSAMPSAMPFNLVTPETRVGFAEGVRAVFGGPGAASGPDHEPAAASASTSAAVASGAGSSRTAHGSGAMTPVEPHEVDLKDDIDDSTLGPVPLAWTTSQNWRLRCKPGPRRLLDAFMNLVCNRALRSMSRLEALALRDAMDYKLRTQRPSTDATPARTIAEFSGTVDKLRRTLESRQHLPLASVNYGDGYRMMREELADRGQAFPRAAPRDPLLETVMGGVEVMRVTADGRLVGEADEMFEPAGPTLRTVAAVRVPLLGTLATRPPCLDASAYLPQVCASQHLRDRAALAAWADVKLEGLRPGFPTGPSRSPRSVFHLREARLRGLPIRGARRLAMTELENDADATACLDRVMGHTTPNPEAVKQERPARGGFIDWRLGRLPLGTVTVVAGSTATAAASERGNRNAATASSGAPGHGSSHPQGLGRMTSVPQTEMEGVRAGRAAVAAGVPTSSTASSLAASLTIDDAASPAAAGDDVTQAASQTADSGAEGMAGDAGQMPTERDDETETSTGSDSDSSVGDVTTVTLHTATSLLGASPGGPFAVLDSRADGIDVTYLFTAGDLLVPALQEHVLARAHWVSAWRAPALAGAYMASHTAYQLGSTASESDLWKQFRETARGENGKAVRSLQDLALADLPLSDVAVWVPAPADKPTLQPKPRPIRLRRRQVDSAAASASSAAVPAATPGALSLASSLSSLSSSSSLSSAAAAAPTGELAPRLVAPLLPPEFASAVGDQTWAQWEPPTPLQTLSADVPDLFASGVQSLDLQGCINIQQAPLVILLRYCPRLASLRLSGMVQLAPSTLLTIPACVPSLRFIDLESIIHVTDDVVMRFARYCPNLQRVNLDGCLHITDAALVGTPFSLCERCVDLKHISLRGCEGISGRGLVTVAKTRPGMLSIDLSGNQHVSVRHLSRALAVLPHLQELKIEIWHKEDQDRARFRILDKVRQAARYCLKNLDPSDPDYRALASLPRFEEAVRAAEEAKAATGPLPGTPDASSP